MTATAVRRPTILIVDDSPGVLQNLEYLLAPHLNVVLAESGAAALRAVTPETALVLADVRMPGMSGVDLARQLRRSHPGLPVAFMTDFMEDDLSAEARELEVLDVLRKPLRPGVLFPALQRWLVQRAAPVPASARGGAALSTSHPAAQPASVQPGAAEAVVPERVRQQAQMFVAGLSVLPGVTAACAFDPQGQPLTVPDPLGAQVGSPLHTLLSCAQQLAPHLGVLTPLRAAQLEFQDRVLVVCPFGGGFAAVLVRDTPGASSVKAWMRSRLH